MGTEYRHGHQVEDVLVTRLERHGCDVVASEELNHTHKLDFVISRFDGIARMRPVGVQVTVRPDAVDKMSEFLFHQRQRPYTERALYIELAEMDTDEIATGVDLIVYSALIHFTFSSEFTASGKRVYGLRVRKDWATEFFDLQQEVERLRAAPVPAAMSSRNVLALRPADTLATPTPASPPLASSAVASNPRGAPLTTSLRDALLQSAGIDDVSQPQRQPGKIVKLSFRGFGFLDTPHGKRYFFLLSQVEDRTLRAELEQAQAKAQPWVDNLDIPVVFKNCGMVRKDVQHPMADRITRREEGTDSSVA